MVTCVPWDGGLHCQNTQSRQVLRAHSYQECCRVSFHHTHLLQEIRDKRLDLDAIAEAMHTKAGTTTPSKTTQARAFHSPPITLLTDQMQAHSPAVAEGSAIRARPGETPGAWTGTYPQERRRPSQRSLCSSRPSCTSPTTSASRCAPTVLPHPQGRRP